MFCFEDYSIGKGNVSLLFSAKCNMNCSYCYIPKDEGMNATQEEVREYLINGDYPDIIKEKSPDITSVDFWGAEPTLNKDLSYIVFKRIMDKLKDVTRFMFSTNLLVGDVDLMEIIESLDKAVPDERKVNLFIQISLDGPDWITDLNRQKGATEKITESYKRLFKKLNNKKFNNIKALYFNFKPTLTSENYRDMVNHPEKIEEWVSFFYELVKYYNDTIENKDFVKMPTQVSPTIVSPGDYSVQDGKMFAEWVRLSKKIDISKYPGFTHPIYKAHQKLFASLFYNQYHNLARSIECGAGSGSYAIGVRGDIHLCHRSFNLEYFMNEVGKSKTILKDLNNKYVADKNEDEKNLQILYTTRGYVDFEAPRLSHSIAMIKMMAKCGQVDKIYLERDDLCDLLAKTSYITLCYLDSSFKTMSFHVPVLSAIRYYGNGALQEFLKDICIGFKREEEI